MNTEKKNYNDDSKMEMLHKFIQEFIGIVELLKTKESDKIKYKLDKDKNSLIIVNKNTMIKILEYHGYLTYKEKLELYKGLGFIEYETNRFTKRYTENKQTSHMVYIRESAYKAIKKLIT